MIEAIFFVTLEKIFTWHKICTISITQANYSFYKLYLIEKKRNYKFFFKDLENFKRKSTHTPPNNNSNNKICTKAPSTKNHHLSTVNYSSSLGSLYK